MLYNLSDSDPCSFMLKRKRGCWNVPAELRARTRPAQRHPDRYTVVIIDDANTVFRREAGGQALWTCKIAPQRKQPPVSFASFCGQRRLRSAVLAGTSEMLFFFVSPIIHDHFVHSRGAWSWPYEGNLRGRCDPGRDRFLHRQSGVSASQTRVDLIKRLAGGRVGLLTKLCDEPVTPERGAFVFSFVY